MWGAAVEGLSRTADAQKKALVDHRTRPLKTARPIGRIHEAHPRSLCSNATGCTASQIQEALQPDSTIAPDGWAGTSAWRRLAIGTSTTFWPVRAVGLRSSLPARSPGGSPVEALVDRDRSKAPPAEPRTPALLPAMSIRFDSIDDALVTGESCFRYSACTTGLRPLGKTTYSETGPHLRGQADTANACKMLGSRE